MKRTTAKNKIRNDIVFILVLVLAVCLVGLLWILLREEGDSVQVAVDGRVIGVYYLSEEQTIEIAAFDGEGHNVLSIRDGKARMETADCPDGICADHRAISKNGESIVCLPHKVVVTVITQEKDAPDVVV